jgi:DNA-binding GntR family transcriptional regulator
MRLPQLAPPLVHTKGQAAYLEIRSRILRGDLEPGTVFSQEALAADLGLSTTPLREALQRLESDGLVFLRAHRDVTVTPLTRRELSELNAVRIQLDPYAGRLAAQNATYAELEAISAAVPRKNLAADVRVAENRRFHRSIYLAANNQLLAEILDLLWDRSDRYRFILRPDEDPGSEEGAGHQAIADALAQRNGNRAAELLSEHINAAQHLLFDRLTD